LPSPATVRAGPSPPGGFPSAVRRNHARDLRSRSGNSVASIARLLGVPRSTIDKEVPELTDGRQPAILEAAPTAPTLPSLTS